jgi:hypothetical protein
MIPVEMLSIDAAMIEMPSNRRAFTAPSIDRGAASIRMRSKEKPIVSASSRMTDEGIERGVDGIEVDVDRIESSVDGFENAAPLQEIRSGPAPMERRFSRII